MLETIPHEVQLVGVGGICLVVGIVLAKLTTRKKRMKHFKYLRDEIGKGYDGLVQASKSFHALNDTLNEVEEGI